MSTRMQRGRQIQAGNRKQLLVFYWVLGAVVIVGVGLLALYVTRNSSSAPATAAHALNASTGMLSQGVTYTNSTGQQVTTPGGLYYKGNPNAPVKVIAYEDFQCPSCGVFANGVEPGINTDYIETGKVQLIFNDFPLSQHLNAPKAAEAARCAGDQNQFWPMHDLLYSRQNDWSDSTQAVNSFITYAANLGLDRSAFETCINSGKTTAAVTAAGMAAQQAGIDATPTFIVNGQSVGTNGLRAAIDAALRTASK